MYEPKDEPYILAYSGGKDSVCVKAILDMAGVNYEAVYNATTVDPPELVRFIISQFDGVVYDMNDGSHKYFKVLDDKLEKTNADDMPANVIRFTIPKDNMRKLILMNRYPPTRLARYCCEQLKENTNPGRITVTGTRRHESVNRKRNSGEVIVYDGKICAKAAMENGLNLIQTNRGGWC
jgi:phosphoadenosine phosphosulfate reductase